MLEVYFKNVKHLLSYILDSEIEQQFFLNTLRSLFSRFELAFTFYYALSEVDPEFRKILKNSRMVDEALRKVLIRENHFEQL